MDLSFPTSGVGFNVRLTLSQIDLNSQRRTLGFADLVPLPTLEFRALEHGHFLVIEKEHRLVPRVRGCVMKSEPAGRCRKRIEDLRVPAVNGLPDDVYHMLHHSFVDIAKMRRSIESADALIDQSREAIFESREMLERLRGGHF